MNPDPNAKAMPALIPASRTKLRQVLLWGAVALVAGGGFLAWQRLKPQGLPPSIASGNGRLEATDTDIATKSGGRVKQVLVREGDNVKAGQTLVIMDTALLEADLARAQAQVRQAQQASATAEALLAQRHQAVTTASAQVAHGRLIGPDGVGKSSLLALLAGARIIQRARSRCWAATWQQGATASRGVPAHRLHAAGAGQEPLSDAVGRSRTSISSAACSAMGRPSAAAHRRTAQATGLCPFPSARPASSPAA
jgi:multidrug efflux pump subunit AcrA (membrane-fusion protein)